MYGLFEFPNKSKKGIGDKAIIPILTENFSNHENMHFVERPALHGACYILSKYVQDGHYGQLSD